MNLDLQERTKLAMLKKLDGSQKKKEAILPPSKKTSRNVTIEDGLPETYLLQDGPDSMEVPTASEPVVEDVDEGPISSVSDDRAAEPSSEQSTNSKDSETSVRTTQTVQSLSTTASSLDDERANFSLQSIEEGRVLVYEQTGSSPIKGASPTRRSILPSAPEDDAEDETDESFIVPRSVKPQAQEDRSEVSIFKGGTGDFLQGMFRRETDEFGRVTFHPELSAVGSSGGHDLGIASQEGHGVYYATYSRAYAEAWTEDIYQTEGSYRLGVGVTEVKLSKTFDDSFHRSRSATIGRNYSSIADGRTRSRRSEILCGQPRCCTHHALKGLMICMADEHRTLSTSLSRS